jgi:TRAP transporter TAXI family solute receptor
MRPAPPATPSSSPSSGSSSTPSGRRPPGRGVRRTLLAALAAALLLGLSACGGERGESGSTSGEGGRLSIATGNTTGVYYILGGGYASLISKNLSGYQATAEATGASVENIQRVVRGDSDIAFTLADSAADAVKGTGPFSSPQPIRALARLYPNYTQVLARTGADVRTVADLRGKRVSTGSPNSGTEIIANRVLTAAGLDPDKDIKRQSLSLPETAQGLKDGTLDAMFFSGGLPTAGVTDVTTSLKGGIRFVPLGADILGKLQGQYGEVYSAATIGKDVYSQPADTPTVSAPNLLVVKEGMDSDLAHDLTKLLFDKQAELVKVHPAAKGITKATARQSDPIPLHPGSERYFTEQP